MSLGAVATYAEWTPAEDATMRDAYSTGGIEAARAALPHRGQASIYHRPQRLKLVRRRRWTEHDDARLRFLWDGHNTLEEVAAILDRTVATVYWRAQVIDLPLGTPEGWESISDAARRTGYGTGQLRKILRASGGTIRRALSAPGRPPRGKNKHKKSRPRFIVFPADVDAAVESWHGTEPVHAAARRLGMHGATLINRLIRAGVKRRRIAGKPKKNGRPHWRVTPEEVALALAVPRKKRSTPRDWHGRWQQKTEEAPRHDRGRGSAAPSPPAGGVADQGGSPATFDPVQFVPPACPAVPEPVRLGGRTRERGEVAA